MKTVFFICGTHSAGKTTIINHLFDNNIINFKGEEIGKNFYYEHKFLTEQQDFDFELKVTYAELKRDYEVSYINGISIIESWHPGNLAYTSLRNPQGYKTLLEITRESPLINHIRGIWLYISDDEIPKRTKTFFDRKEWAKSFYRQMNPAIKQSLIDLNLYHKTIIIDANKPINEVYNEVVNYINACSENKTFSF